MTAVPALGPAHSAAGRGHEEAVKGASAAIQPQREWRANQRRQGSIVQLHERGAWPATEREGGLLTRGRRAQVTSSGEPITSGAGLLLYREDRFTLCPALSTSKLDGRARVGRFSNAPCGNISAYRPEHRIDCEVASLRGSQQTCGLRHEDRGPGRGKTHLWPAGGESGPHQLSYRTRADPVH